MKLPGVAYRKLGAVDAGPFQEALARDAARAWPESRRADHRDVALLSLLGDSAGRWYAPRRHEAYGVFEAALAPVRSRLGAAFDGGDALELSLVALDGGSEILPHRVRFAFSERAHHVIVALQADDSVALAAGGSRVPLAVGDVIELDTEAGYGVQNHGDEAAIFLVAEWGSPVSRGEQLRYAIGTSRFEGAAVERVSAPMREVFRRYVAMNWPVLLTGVATEWPAISRWSIEYFRTVCANRTLLIEEYPDGYANQGARVRGKCATAFMSFEEFLSSAAAQKGHFYWTADPEELPALRADFTLPEYIDRGAYLRSTVFVGYESLSSGHYHEVLESFLCQVVGTKTVALYHPRDLRHLDMEPWYSSQAVMSRANFDGGRGPRDDANPLEVTVRPGEMLFIPHDWLHVVRGGPEFTSSVTLFWKASPRRFPRLASRLRRFTSLLE